MWQPQKIALREASEMDPDQEKENFDEQVVQLISGCQRPLFLFLLGLLCSWDLAEDTLQETNAVIWRKRSQYQPGTNFFAWACSVAFLEAQTARRKQRRNLPVFSDVFLHGIAPELVAAAESSDPWIFALKECVEQLSERDRELLQGRYDEGSSIQALAADAGRSTDTIYKLLRRIHGDLFDCITAKFKEDDRP